ncbi:MAG: TolC family protein [Polyangiaceae bacterium]
MIRAQMVSSLASLAFALGVLSAAGPSLAQPAASPAPSTGAPAAAPSLAQPAASPAPSGGAATARSDEDAGTSSTAAATASTSTSGALTLAEVVRVAQERFPLATAAEADAQGAEGELLAAEGGFDPLFRTTGAVAATGAYPTQRIDTVVEQPTPLWGASAFAGYRLGLGTFAVYDGKAETNEHGELRAGLKVPVLRDGPIDKRRAAIQRAEIAVEIAKLGVDQQKIEIARLSSMRYWDWVGAGASLDIVEAWLALAEKRDADLATRVERGEIPEIEHLENQRSLLARRAQVVTYTRRLQQTSIELSLFYRNADGSPKVPGRGELPKSIPEPAAAPSTSLAAAEASALARRPEPKRAEAARASAAVALDLARNQQLPAIDVYVAGSADLGPGDSKRGIPVLEAGIVIDIPILGRPQRGKVRAAEAAVKRADKQAELSRDRVGADVKDAQSAFDAARDRAEIAGREVALAEKLAGLELRRFNLGDSNMLTVNLREQAAAEAHLKRIAALIDHHKAVAAQRAAQGLSTPR